MIHSLLNLTAQFRKLLAFYVSDDLQFEVLPSDQKGLYKERTLETPVIVSVTFLK